MSLNPIVRVSNVTKVIGGKKLIDNLSFDIPRGEVFGFLGPNGAGKTTTIRMMVGLMSITAGDISIEGFSIAKNYEKAIQNVGAIVENPEFYKFLSGFQNLVHYARMSRSVSKERINEVVRLVGLEDRIHDKVKTYSLGMRQRLGIAQALLHSPSLLILDEPTNGLDPAGIRELRDYLKKLTRNEGISVFVSSHLLSEMELMCDRVAIIQNGKLVEVKTVREFVHDEEKEAAPVFFEVDQPGLAVKVLKLKLPEAPLVAVKEQGIEVTVQREQIPMILEMMMKAQIKVYGIQKTIRTLEDKFLQITGSEKIV
jgi:ABC-2 type transport system ATP-binding protein